MKNIVLFSLLFIAGCMPSPINHKKISGKVVKTYEVPTYKARSIKYHVVIKDVSGVGYDVVVTREQAAQYVPNDSVTLNMTMYDTDQNQWYQN